MTTDQIKALFSKWLRNNGSEEERSTLLAALREADPILLEKLVAESFDSAEIEFEQDAATRELIFRQITGTPATDKKVRKMYPAQRNWLRYAAIVILLAGIGIFSWVRFDAHVIAKNNSQLPADVPPGHDGAVLTLADGSKVVLDSVGNGVIASQQGTTLLLKNGQLAYHAASAAGAGYNTLSTPRRRQFQLVLPDGSKVWLNAASSLRYPTAFTGTERRVEVTGEAYFVIAKNTTMPFKVAVNGTEIQVLGTQFNVNAYADEPIIKTTLEQGQISLSAGQQRVLLKPGQQAQVPFSSAVSNVAERHIQVTEDDVHVEEIVAWKNGFFYLNSDDIPAALRQIARWYNLEVVFKNGIPQGHLSGRTERSLYLSQMLKVLELSGVHVQLEGNKLMVSP